jgi:magnesium transporter
MASRFFHVTPKGRVKRLDTLQAALEERARGGYVLLDYTEPTREELDPLVEPLEVHPLSVEDCLDDVQVPKVDAYPRNTFLLFNQYAYRDGELRVDEVDFILGTDFLVSVHKDRPGEPPFHDRLEETLNLETESVRKGPDFLLHVLLDHVVDGKCHTLEAFQEEMEDVEEAVLKGAESFQPERLMNLRRGLLALRKSLFHEREVLVKVCRRDSPFIGEKAIYHFRDAYDHVAKYYELTEMSREMVTGLMEIALSMQNNRMARLANRTNAIMRRLTMITTVFMPLTLLAGIGGMSEWSMVTGPQNWAVSYPAFFGLMGLVGGASYGVLRWMERRTGDGEA